MAQPKYPQNYPRYIRDSLLHYSKYHTTPGTFVTQHKHELNTTPGKFVTQPSVNIHPLYIF